MYSILFLAGTAFIYCYLLTPLVASWSRGRGILDRPQSGRKCHTVPTPRTGGIAIALSFLISVGLLVLSPLNGADIVNLPYVLSLLPATGLVFAVGLLDDLVGLKARGKLVVEICAACLAYWAGVRILGVAGVSAPEWLSLVLTVLWLVACANAFNLIDGVDGLAAGIGLFATTTTFLAALLQGNAPLALATAPLAGALLAFLRYNFSPASIFLGDCGSLTTGFVLGCFAVVWSQKSATLLGMTAPLMALAVPLLDTGVSVVRRFLRRQPIFTADRNHLHHRLLERGFTPRKVALLLYGVCGLAAAFSLLQTVPGNRFHGLVLVVFCATVWMGVRRAGYVEFDMAHRLTRTGTFRHILNARLFVTSFEKKVAEAVTADECWELIRDAGREIGCAHVRMALPGAVYEDSDPTREFEHCCTIRIPLFDDGYVNFRYPVESSVRHAVAISSIAQILQHSLPSMKQELSLPSPRRKHDIAVHRSDAREEQYADTLAETVTHAGG